MVMNIQSYELLETFKNQSRIIDGMNYMGFAIVI